MPKQVPPIDDDVYAYVQSQAVPLEENFNSALRRLLGLSHGEAAATPAPIDSGSAAAGKRGSSSRTTRARSRTSTRARKGSLLPEREYELPILEALTQFGGRAPTSEVVDIVGEKLNGRLTEVDQEPLASGDLRWRNRAQFVRLALIKRGDMKADSPRGMWEITEQGTRRIHGGPQ